MNFNGMTPGSTGNDWKRVNAPSACHAGSILLVGLMGTLARAQCAAADDDHASIRSEAHPLQEYDFVIAGGGTAGCVLANRLSENPAWKILLLEAGDSEPPNTRIPGMVETFRDTDIDWGYRSVPQRSACLSSEGRRCVIPRGKVLGGSSVINRMKYIRGNRRDYDAWEAAGNHGWSYNDVLPYFLKSEGNNEPWAVEKEYHSYKGPLRVERFRNHSRLSDAILGAGKEMGYRVDHDANGKHQAGFFLAQTTSSNGTRFSAARAFLNPAVHRKNLHVLKRTFVRRVLLDPSGERASGVEYDDSEGKRRKAFAAKEVIVSCGSIATPQLLMLSGIGPGEHLRFLGIPVVHDLRVGDNLQDHVGVQVPFESTAPTRATENEELGADFLAGRKGPLTSTGLSQTVAFVSARSNDLDYPDVQMFFSGDPSLCSKQEGKLKCEYRDVQKRFTMVPVLLRPESRGTVRLASTDPSASPLVDPRYLSERRDVEGMIAGVRVAERIGRTRSLASVGVMPATSAARGCEAAAVRGIDYWECAARRFTVSACHAVGTAKMGPPSDPTAVVDPRLRVYGVENLRVVDASVMPTITSGNTNAPTIMIAEKAADMIKEEWRIYG